MVVKSRLLPEQIELFQSDFHQINWKEHQVPECLSKPTGI